MSGDAQKPQPSLDPSRLTAAHVREGVVSGQFSAREITTAVLDRIESVDGDLHAFLQVTPELAYEAADRVDAARAAAVADGLDPSDVLPALAGVPTSFKDNMNLVGTHTTCGSKILGPYESVYDCTAVRRMLDAGAIPVGKNNCDEFAFGSSTENSAYGPSQEPLGHRARPRWLERRQRGGCERG